MDETPADRAGAPSAQAAGLAAALRHPDASARLEAALAAGTRPDPAFIAPLVARCAVEPDFFVRDMLTWALVRHPAEQTVAALIGELDSPRVQGRSQALHTLSKIGEASAWPAITRAHLLDPHEAVARAAWRAAVTLVPPGAEAELAAVLTSQLGRGAREVQSSLSRALTVLGDAARPALRLAVAEGGSSVRAHARASLRMLEDPEAGFEISSRDLAPADESELAASGATGRHQEPGE